MHSSTLKYRPGCLNTSTFPDWFGPCQLVLSEMLPSQFVRQLVAAARSKKQQGCDCTKFVSLHFKQPSTAIPAGFASSDTSLCPRTVPQACSEKFWLRGTEPALWFHTKLLTHWLCASLFVLPLHCSGCNSSHPGKSEAPLFPESRSSNSVVCSLTVLYLKTGKSGADLSWWMGVLSYLSLFILERVGFTPPSLEETKHLLFPLPVSGKHSTP